LLTAKFKQTTHINTKNKCFAEELAYGLLLSIFGPVIRKAPDTFETSGTTRTLTASHLRRLTFSSSAVRKSNLVCLYVRVHFGFGTPPWKRKHGWPRL